MSFQFDPLIVGDYLDNIDDDEEEGVAMLMCTGRGRVTRPSLMNMLQRLPKSAKRTPKSLLVSFICMLFLKLYMFNDRILFARGLR